MVIMMSHYWASFVLLIVLVSSAGIHAENETKSPTKLELCEETYGKCMSMASILESIAKRANSEAMSLKFDKDMLVFDKRDINQEIESLRNQLANPDSQYQQIELQGRSGAGIPEMRLRYPAFNNCASLLDCLGKVGELKSYWTELEEMKTNFTIDITRLQSEKDVLLNIRQNLTQQIRQKVRNNRRE